MMRTKNKFLTGMLVAYLSFSGTIRADGVLDGIISEQYGATIAIDDDRDALCGFNGVDAACARGDLIDLNALSWPDGANGNQWYFTLTIDSSQPLDDLGSPTPDFFDNPCGQRVNYFIGIDAGCDGASFLGMWQSGQSWQRNFQWEVDYFIALYATGPDSMVAELWQNNGSGNARSLIIQVPVVTTVIGFRRQIEIMLPDLPVVPASLRNNEPISIMALSSEDFDGTDAGIYDWIGGAAAGDCQSFAGFTAEEMLCTAPNSKTVGRPTDPGENNLQSLSLPRREFMFQITSELDCAGAADQPIIVDGNVDAGRYYHLAEANFAAPYAGGSFSDSDFVGESSASTYYNSSGLGLSTFTSGGDADIQQIRVASDPNYLYVIVEGPTALGWDNEADRANLYVAIDVPTLQSNTDTGNQCDTEPNAPAGRMINFKGWDPDAVIELIWQGSSVLWTSDGSGGWQQIASAGNEASLPSAVTPEFYYGGEFGAYEFAIPWSQLGYTESVFDSQNVKLSVYTTADENTDGRSDWDVFDQAPGVGQGCTGLGCHERIGDDPGDSDCINGAVPLLSDFTPYVGATADNTAVPASDSDLGSNLSGLAGNDIDTIEEYFTFDVFENPIFCTDLCSSDETPPEVECPPQYVDACDLPDVALSADDFDAQGGFISDNCDGEISIQHLGDINEGGSGCEDDPIIILREYRIYDANGNFTDCMQEIYIVDFEVPELEAPEDIEIECDQGTDPEVTGMAIATDNCDDAVLSYSDEVEGDCLTVITRTWTVTDPCGHSESAVQFITVVDNTPPELIVPDEMTINSGADTSPESTGMAVATDNCSSDPVISYEDDVIPGDCEGSYTIERYWVAADACENVAEASQVINVIDTVAPVLMVPDDLIIQCSDDSSPDGTGQATAIDNFDSEVEISYTDEVTPGSCDNASVITRTWIASDTCGNDVEGVQTITVVDTTAPELTIPDDVEIECDASTDPESTGQATAVDNCDNPGVFYSDEITGTCPVTITRTWSAVDACGNISAANQTITVVDNTLPELTVPGETTVECGADSSPAATGEATATDNCAAAPVISFEDDVIPGECAGSYTIERYWAATDACGNVAEGSSIIYVIDTTAPTLVVPDDITIACSDDSSPDGTGLATALDGCDSEPAVTFSDVITQGECDHSYVITRTWTASDACENSVEGVQTITVVDDTSPQLSIPDDIEIECDSSTDPEFTGQASAIDDCDNPGISYSDVSEGTCPMVITRTWTAIDACGNISSADQTITVVDNTIPELVVPETVTLDCNGDTSVEATGMATATDNCDAAPVVAYEDDMVPGDCEGSYTIERFWSATDACGNVAEASSIINVVDTTDPELTIPADITIECSDDSSPEGTGQATASDSCDSEPGVTFADAVAPGGCDHESVITRTWTATDACGNEVSADQLITVVDTTAPVLTIPGDVEVECGSSTEPDTTGQATATDNCDNPGISYSDISSGTCPAVITRTWTAIDACGNFVSADQIITVADSQPPVITVPGDVSLEGNASTDPEDTGTATANDSCGSVTVTYSDVFSGNCPAEITRTWTAVDTCGNEVSADQIISLNDTTAPVITCPPDTSVACGDQNTDPSQTGTATAEDNCSAEVSITYADAVSSGNIIRTWTATDGAGNSSICQQIISLSGGGGGGIELIGCPEDLTLSMCDEIPVPVVVTAVDGCQNPLPVTFTEKTITTWHSIWNSHYRFIRSRCQRDDDVVILRTWTAQYGEGNTASCEQVITIDQGRNCVQDMDYWGNHPLKWPVNTLTIGCESYGKIKLLITLKRSPRGDETIILAQQLIAALLNVEKGACPRADVREAIESAQSLLCQYPVGSSKVPNGISRKMSNVADRLESFNEGDRGTRECRD